MPRPDIRHETCLRSVATLQGRKPGGLNKRIGLAMALKATVYKASLQISDMDRHYYQTHDLTIALHPSETEERMMVRLLAFALYADEGLAFTKGISTEDEPDLWRKSLSDEIELWIELGQPDEKRMRRACGRSESVVVVNYSDKGDIWWDQNAGKYGRFDNLSVVRIAESEVSALMSLCRRTMQLSVTIQDGEVWVSSNDGATEVHPVKRA